MNKVKRAVRDGMRIKKVIKRQGTSKSRVCSVTDGVKYKINGNIEVSEGVDKESLKEFNKFLRQEYKNYCPDLEGELANV